jgi:hypothetical protein
MEVPDMPLQKGSRELIHLRKIDTPGYGDSSISVQDAHDLVVNEVESRHTEYLKALHADDCVPAKLAQNNPLVHLVRALTAGVVRDETCVLKPAAMRVMESKPTSCKGWWLGRVCCLTATSACCHTHDLCAPF